MIDLEVLYFEWLLSEIDFEHEVEGVDYVCDLLHQRVFHRRVGRDINRAIDGVNLRNEFFLAYEEVDFNQRDTRRLLKKECSWLEMLVALAKRLDWTYEGGILGRFIELLTNMGLSELIVPDIHRTRDRLYEDKNLVAAATSDIDNNRFLPNGHGGLFPLSHRDHLDQREVEIWEQHAAYFREKLEGGLWTSIN